MTLTRSGEDIAAHFARAMAALLEQEAGAADERASAWPAGPIRETDGAPLRPRFNLVPSRDALTLSVGPDGATPAFHWRHWGLIPAWAKDRRIGQRTFNARAETLAEKPSFRAAFRRRRCVVVADGFYEWTPKRRDQAPNHFTPLRQPLLGFAGLYESWTGEDGDAIDSCTVVTTDANADVEAVHHRMPVVLDPSDYATWLDPAMEATTVQSLLIPARPGTLARRPVTRYVNDPRHDDARCLTSEPEAIQGALFELESAEEEF